MQDDSSVELVFFDDVSAASRLVQCYAVALMRPFQFANPVSIRNGMRQLAELSKQNLVIQLRLLLESMVRSYTAHICNDFI